MSSSVVMVEIGLKGALTALDRGEPEQAAVQLSEAMVYIRRQQDRLRASLALRRVLFGDADSGASIVRELLSEL